MNIKEFGDRAIQCPKCHVYNLVSSTFCSACEELLPKSATMNLNIILGTATHSEWSQEYADYLYNTAIKKMFGTERDEIKDLEEFIAMLEEVNNLLGEAMHYYQHPDYSFFYGMCRLALDDSAGAIKSFEDIKSQQYAREYPFWPLPVSPSDFQYNFELLKQDKTPNIKIFDNLLKAYKEYSDRRREKKL